MLTKQELKEFKQKVNEAVKREYNDDHLSTEERRYIVDTYQLIEPDFPASNDLGETYVNVLEEFGF